MANRDLWNMVGLDIFVQSLNEVDRKKYIEEIHPKHFLSPLKSWGLSAEFFTPTDLLEAREQDQEKLLCFAKQFQWKTDLTKILTASYEALVLTDVSQKVIWTNPGFFKMTGYSESYAIGKRPSFLQGAGTSTATRFSIKEKLLTGQPFMEKILNYKANSEEYWCQIRVFPLHTKDHKTHYLALETELL